MADSSPSVGPGELKQPTLPTLAQALLASVRDAIIAIDSEMRVTYFSPGAEALYSISAQAAFGAPLSSLIEWSWLNPEDEAQAYAALDAVGSWQGQNVHVLRSGQRRHVESTVLRLVGEDGVSSGMLALIRDVTEREAERAALRESEERSKLVAGELQALVDAVPAGVFIARDRESVRIDANRFGLELLRQPSGANVSLSAPEDERPAGFRCFKDGVEMSAAELPVQRVALTGVAIRGFEWDLVFDNGEVRNVFGNIEPLFDGSGAPRGAVSAVVDITERKSADKVAEETRKRLLSVISHELRNPLNAMGIAVDVLKARLSTPEERRLLDTVARNLKLQSRLVDDLLDVSRASRGKLVSQRVPCQLDDAIVSVLEMLGPEATARGLKIEIELGAPDHVFGDRSRLEQVITNLLSNAIKFTPEGGLIGIRTRQREQHSQLLIRDSGMGMSHEQLQRAFEQFQQGEVATSSKRGLGLGLAIARAIVEEHEGRIWAESEGAGKGTLFGVELPSMTAESRSVPSISVAARSGTISALIVEDNDDTRKLLTTSLENKGYRIRSAASADLAWALLEGELPDLLLADINLDGESGVDLVRRLKASPRLMHLPVFAVTAQDSRDDVRRLRDAGFSGHFVKPVDVSALDLAIREFLSSKTG